ncbi:heterokaryon incompatibility protein-domain-containing protein [Cladorrhinum sp. PSN332]|nr:heterokaryon incompatibility protein-domain-containing protein [Cladorrhinum sp. PSN332]
MPENSPLQLEKEAVFHLKDYINQQIQHKQLATPRPCNFQNPHGCLQCETVDISLRIDWYECESCKSRGPSLSQSFYQCSSCGHASDQDPVEGRRVYSASLNHCLPEAIEAAQAGCGLYHWIVSQILSMYPGQVKWEQMAKYMQDFRFELSGSSAFQDQNCTLDCLMFDQQNRSHKNRRTRDIKVGLLEGWTNASDASARYIAARPYNQHVNSPDSTKFAVDCFQTCIKTHEWCRTNQISHFFQHRFPPDGAVLPDEVIASEDIPTRLLAIDNDRIRLIETKDRLGNLTAQDIPSAGFLTLSYCWGNYHPVKLTHSSYASLTQGIDPSTLAKTIQDAVEVARTMQFRYVWVDCLCIIQDDEGDKAIEIARLSQYYRRSTITISAASAITCAEGFLQPRTHSHLAAGPIRIPIKLELPVSSSIGHIYLVAEPDEPPQEPISSRAWTLQETLLSRRLLIYGVRQLSWSCVNSFAGVGGPIRALTDRMIPGSQAPTVKDMYPVGSQIASPIRSQWYSLSRDFSSRMLSFGEDKLLAISALAEHMVEVCRARQLKGIVYAAGLLVAESEDDDADAHTWSQALLWRPERPAFARRWHKYRAPSWSWASIDGTIEEEFGRRGIHELALATVESHHVELAVAGAPFGAVTGGYVELKGGMAELCQLLAKDRSPPCSMEWGGDIEKPGRTSSSVTVSHLLYSYEGPDWHLVLRPDCLQDKSTVEQALVEKADSNEDTARVLLAGLTSGRPKSVTDIWTHVKGIIIERTIADEEDSYRRLGVFKLKCLFDFFTGLEQTTIKIV